MEVVTLCRSLRRLVGGLQKLVEPFRVVDGRGLPRRGLADPVETGVHRDAVQPGGDGGLAAEGVGGAERGDQRVLYGISRFLAVAQCPEGHGPQPVAMRRASSPKASGSPATWSARRSASLGASASAPWCSRSPPLSCRHPCIQTDPRQKVNGEVGWIIGMTKSAFRLRFECAPSALY